ncbi:unnamed protein product, partial [Prorocentrum cordatum]
MALVERALGEVRAELHQIIARFLSDGQVIKAWDSILDVLKPRPQLLRTTTAAASRVGVSPDNRGGFGFEVAKTLSNLGKHCRAGWSYARASCGSFAVEVPRGTPEGEKWVDFNHRLSVQSGIPPHDVMELASFGGTHCNVAIRATSCKMACSDEFIAPSGYLGEEYICQKWPTLRDALNRGLEWQ